MANLQDLTGGYNSHKIIDVEDVHQAAASDDATATIQVFGIPAGGIVSDVTLYKVTNFWGGTNASCNVEVGDGTDPNGFVTAKNLSSGGDSYGYCDGAYFTVGSDATTLNGKLYSSADTVDVVVTPSASVAALTQGEFIVLANIREPSNYVPN